jgi:hypothetical protein
VEPKRPQALYPPNKRTGISKADTELKKCELKDQIAIRVTENED